MPFAILRVIPIWAWALAAALGWGAWQSHRATAAAAETADVHAETARLRERATAASLTETTRRIGAQAEVTRDATAKAARARADRAAAVRAADRVSARAGELAARAAACDSTVAGEREAAADAARVLADLLRRADERAGVLAAVADERGIAGATCERAYQALTSP
jgi:hypothetical protein